MYADSSDRVKPLALFELVVVERQEPLHVGLGDRPAVRPLQERPQQPLGVLRGIADSTS